MKKQKKQKKSKSRIKKNKNKLIPKADAVSVMAREVEAGERSVSSMAKDRLSFLLK